MASRTQIKSIIIVGAGLAGLAAAIGLRKSGYYVMVLEKTSKLEDVGLAL
jgi:salicylate hydroxylase